MGSWPCGTITMISELFSAESKTQVYGTLHTFLQENQDETKEIGQCTCPYGRSTYSYNAHVNSTLQYSTLRNIKQKLVQILVLRSL